MLDNNSLAWTLKLEGTCDLNYLDPKESQQYLNAAGHRNPDWVPPQLEMWCDEDEYGMAVSPKDFLYFQNAFACNEKTKGILEPYCEATVEFLPLLCGRRRYYYMNCVRIIDALDRSRSSFIVREEKPDEIIAVVRYVFQPGCLEGQSLFRIPEDKSALFATQQFVELVNDNGLSGMEFYLES